jgi:hypothetical protein
MDYHLTRSREIWSTKVGNQFCEIQYLENPFFNTQFIYSIRDVYMGISD